MKAFAIELRDAAGAERIEGVVSFVGSDASGSFGLLAGHARFLTLLEFGLHRFRDAGGWHYLALPGGLLHFVDDELRIATRRYLRDDDYTRISRRLEEEMRAEERELGRLKASLRQMEEALFRRLRELARG